MSLNSTGDRPDSFNKDNQRLFSKSLVDWIGYSLVFAIVGITLISLGSSLLGWRLIFELLSHFKVQYLVLTLLLCGLVVLTRRKPLILISLFCLSILFIEILPWYVPPAWIRSNRNPNLRVLVANINTQNQNYDKVLALVRNEKPDVAVFMEIDEAWVKRLNSLVDILPASISKPNPYNLGIAVYSKLPLENNEIKFWGNNKNPTVVGNLTINGQIISLIATHPFPPAKQTFFHSRNAQLDQIGQYIQSLSTPVVIIGDLNITMWSPYYKRLIGKTGLSNARKGFGILPTWPVKASFSPVPSYLSLFLSIPLDHCLVSPKIKVAQIRTGANVGSDHRPLITDLVIPEKKS